MPVGVAELLRGLPGDVDLDVFLALGERGIEPGLLPVGESFLPGAEDVADPVVMALIEIPQSCSSEFLRSRGQVSAGSCRS